MKIYKVEEILEHLNNCIIYKKPFSHIRFGDGGIKFLHSILYKDYKQLATISQREGLPVNKFVEIFELWGYFARKADYIDTPEVYFNGSFWPRMRNINKGMTPETKERMMMWKELYDRSEFDNNNYCNPESNYLMILRMDENRNLIDLMKDKKVCIITAKPEVKKVLSNYNIDIIKIVGHYEDQYENSFNSVIDIIKETANDYDFWFVAAGELGRIYTGTIKEYGGRAIDIGFVIEFWLGESLHPRLTEFIKRSEVNYLELKLTKSGSIYSDYI